MDLSHPGREQGAPAVARGSTTSQDKYTYFPLGTFQDLNKVTMCGDRTEQGRTCKVQLWLLQEPRMMPIQRGVRRTQREERLLWAGCSTAERSPAGRAEAGLDAPVFKIVIPRIQFKTYC